MGGGAAALVAIDDYIRGVSLGQMEVSTAIFVVLGAVFGAVTFSGSLIASGKLQGIVSGQPIFFPGSRLLTVLLALITLAGFALLVLSAANVVALSSEIEVLTLGVIVLAGAVSASR